MAVNIGPRIGIDGEAEYRKQINNIIQQTKTLKAEMTSLTSAYDKDNKSLTQNANEKKLLTQQIEAQKNKVAELTAMMEKSAAKYGENDTKTLKWKEAVAQAQTELNKLQATLKTMPSSLDMVGAKFQAIGGKITAVSKQVTAFGRTMSLAITAPVVAGFGKSAQAAVDWESAFTGVMKTVDETSRTSYADLERGINEIAQTTASSQNEIAAVMEVAGQLGVTADDAVDFTKIMVELGDTTNLSADEAASSIAKFANVTHMSLADVDKLGSVIVDLGNNYATTEQDIMEMATRLSGAGAQVGLTQGEILGLATALSSVGIEAEMGGSAFSKALIKMQVAVETGNDRVKQLEQQTGLSLREIELMASNDSKAFKDMASSLGMTTKEINDIVKSGNNLQDFASVAKMSTDEFVNLYQTDAPAAIQAFIQGLGDVEGHGQSTIAMLQEMGFTEVRLRDTLTRLANSGDLVTNAITQGNQAWSENAALSAEAEKRYATVAAQMQQLKNTVTEVGVEIGEMLIPYLQKGAEKVKELVEWWKSLDDEHKETILKVAAVAAAIGPVLVVLGTLGTAIGGIVTGLGVVIPAIGAAAGALATVGGAAVAALPGVLAFMAPFLPFIAIAAAVVAAGVLIYKNWDKIKEFGKKLGSTIKQEWDGIKSKTTAAWNTVKSTVTNVMTGITSNVGERLNRIRSAFNENGGGIKGAVAAGWQAIKEYYRAGFDAINSLTGGRLGEIASQFRAKFSEIGSQAVSWGRDIIQGIINGITSKISGIRNAVSSVANTIRSYLHFSEPDKGPLSDFHTYMPDMMKSLAQGMISNLGVIENAATQVAGAILPNTEQNAYNYGGFTVNVYGAEGQDVNELADIVSEKINDAINRGGAVWA